MVDAAGLVRTLAMSGEAAIMARYQGHVAAFRATVPLGVKMPDYKFEPQDRRRSVHAQEVAGAGPGAVGPVHRRAVHPPGVARHHRHAADAGAGARPSWPTPTRTSATSWSIGCWRRRSTATTSPTSGPTSCASSAAASRTGPRAPSPSTTGSARRSPRTSPTTSSPARSWRPPATRPSSPPTVWYKELQKPEQFVDDTAQVFLGLRMACAQCHHHPYEKWSQDDYWGLAAFFGRVGRKNVAGARRASRTSRTSARSIFNRSVGQRHQQAHRPAGRHEAARRRADEGRRRTTTRGRSWWTGWSTPKNPFFARAVANRYWAHFFGRGIVDPLDDMRVTNPPSQPRAARRPGQGPGRAQVQPQAPDQDDLQEPDLPAQRRCPTSSTSTTSRTTPATIRSAWRPRCCSTRSAR